MHVVACLGIANAAPRLRFCAGAQVRDGEGDVYAVLVAGERLGFQEPVDFLSAVRVAVCG